VSVTIGYDMDDELSPLTKSRNKAMFSCHASLRVRISLCGKCCPPKTQVRSSIRGPRSSESARPDIAHRGQKPQKTARAAQPTVWCCTPRTSIQRDRSHQPISVGGTVLHCHGTAQYDCHRTVRQVRLVGKPLASVASAHMER
jgi:hypothetical protein